MSESLRAEDQSYPAILRERMGIVDSALDAVANSAVPSSSDLDISESIANGMNNGTLPRVIRGTSYLGSGFEVFLMNGNVPPSAIYVKSLRDNDGRVLASEIALSTKGRETLSLGSEDFWIETHEGMLPQMEMGADPPDWEFIAKLDAHIPPDGLLPPPTIS